MEPQNAQQIAEQNLDLPTKPQDEIPTYIEAKRRFDTDYLTAVITAAGGNMAEAARRAGLNRRSLYRMLDQLGMKVERHHPSQPPAPPAQETAA